MIYLKALQSSDQHVWFPLFPLFGYITWFTGIFVGRGLDNQSLTPTDSFSSVQQKCLRIKDISYDPLIKDSTHKNVHLTLGLGHRHLNTCQAPQIQPPETMPGNLTLWKSCLEWCIAGMSGPLHHSVRVCVHVVQSSAKVAKDGQLYGL